MRNSEEEFVRDIRALFSAEKGGAARRLAASYLKRYPGSLRARYYFAVALSEITAGLPKTKVASHKKRTVALLGELMKERRRMTPVLADAVANEYFWFSEQPKKQYELGLLGIKKKIPGASYSCGVGAAMMALKAGRSGASALRDLWARRSIAAWGTYHREFDERFGSVLYEALAWGAAGDRVRMQRRLQRCAKLAGVSSANHSIRWVRREVQGLLEMKA